MLDNIGKIRVFQLFAAFSVCVRVAIIMAKQNRLNLSTVVWLVCVIKLQQVAKINKFYLIDRILARINLKLASTHSNYQVSDKGSHLELLLSSHSENTRSTFSAELELMFFDLKFVYPHLPSLQDTSRQSFLDRFSNSFRLWNIRWALIT